MRELLFQSNIGIRFVKEVHKGICTVKVQSRNANRAMTLMSYTFPNVELSVSSPFLSWENLNCCGGWTYDEKYLFTAVQEGKKLYAGAAIYVGPTGDTSEAEARLKEITSSLPSYCKAGKEIVENEKYFPFYICRRGCLKDFFDLEKVLEDYKQMGITLYAEQRERLFTLSEIELAQFASAIPMCYYETDTDAELIATGLLLGYPLESTASILLGN